ncbi:hypothetical protein GCM10018980_22890 [Streptomyces capoamus]|uniref:Calcineurin-like phosphoesterase domain-containing protein n=1 Tax=Streptomyces capoamus TaxID=68183 RepID=A0A919C310_9ACTN|nr:hypothetical protein [Streptomyces capoamus]GGW09236.1 hypothetical protein GCM10010501_01000 [Streptomyces libani subsp. rufus]GHG44715.1 hypothetical protein GCM10018980_22890 [Streptomyces capoamus]
MLKRGLITLAAVGLASSVLPAATASAADSPLTLAVFGDSPYGKSAYAPGGQTADTSQFRKVPAFIGTINSDPTVSDVIQVGDIHSGKEFCTEDYDASIATTWQTFSKPLLYTPGDNEWADCHKASSLTSPGQGGGFYDPSLGAIKYIGASGLSTDPADCVSYRCGNPLDNLAKIRQDFFAQPGHTLGSGTLNVVSQATAYDPSHPGDAQYVENVMWAQNDIVFVTINVPGGSNNDADPWYKVPTATQAQTDERTDRAAADVRWLDAAFADAQARHAKAVVISTQADMWDLDGKSKDHLTNYEPIISEVAAKSTEFKRPVLMLNGDSHLYRSDNPLSPTAACTGETDPATGSGICTHDPGNNAWIEHPYYNVPNFHRIVVHGSTTPLEWLRLTADPNANHPATGTTYGPFSWQRMPQPQL